MYMLHRVRAILSDNRPPEIAHPRQICGRCEQLSLIPWVRTFPQLLMKPVGCEAACPCLCRKQRDAKAGLANHGRFRLSCFRTRRMPPPCRRGSSCAPGSHAASQASIPAQAPWLLSRSSSSARSRHSPYLTGYASSVCLRTSPPAMSSVVASATQQALLWGSESEMMPSSPAGRVEQLR